MKFVVDTNILITFFWKNSISKELFNNQDLELYSPEFALEELNKYSDEIKNKAGIDESEFQKLKNELIKLIKFIPLKEYSDQLFNIHKKIPDVNDIDFIGLALKLKCDLWSNDKLLKKQHIVRIFNTKEIIDIFD